MGWRTLRSFVAKSPPYHPTFMLLILASSCFVGYPENLREYENNLNSSTEQDRCYAGGCCWAALVFITTSRFLYKIYPFFFFLLSLLSVYSSISIVYNLHGNLKQLSLWWTRMCARIFNRRLGAFLRLDWNHHKALMRNRDLHLYVTVDTKTWARAHHYYRHRPRTGLSQHDTFTPLPPNPPWRQANSIDMFQRYRGT